MKITKIECKKIKTPLKFPFRISLGLITHSISVVVQIHTDEGLVGIGEGAPGILITGETLLGTEECIQTFEQALIGVDPTDIEKVYWILDQSAAHAATAKAAIDLACYDLIGKKANQPVYKILGGYDNKIKTDITLGIDEPAIMAQKAKEYVTQYGFDTIKTKVGTTFQEDIARIKAIREAVGSDVLIRIDANQAWSGKEAVRIIERLNEYDIELVEQPVKYFDIEGLAFVTQHANVPIMSDESCFNSKDALRLIEKRAVDYVNIKLMKCGGIREALKINSICEAAGVECMLGCMVEETNIGVTAAASLGAAVKNITRADLDAAFFLSDVVYPGGTGLALTKDLILPEKPGYGLEITN